MAIQDDYAEVMQSGVPGAIADTANKDLMSRTVEGAAIGFGLPLAQGDTDYGVRATTTGDTEIVGITVRDQSTFGDEFAVGDSARVLEKGTIWVTTAVAVAARDDVLVTVADGSFTNVVAAGNVAIDGARFDDTGDANAVVRIRLT